MSNPNPERLRRAVCNLVFNCAGCNVGDRLLIVRETENDGYYEPELALSVADMAQDIGLVVRIYEVPFQPKVCDLDAQLADAIAVSDCTIFFARIGDQIRFRKNGCIGRQVISYALDRDMFTSSFGTVAYEAFDTLKNRIDDAFREARVVRVCCPSGTDFTCDGRREIRVEEDVALKRFPISIFAPIHASAFKGRIAQNGFLTGTGSNYYHPYTCPLEETLLVEFDGYRIIGFDGVQRDRIAAKDHFEFVGNTLGIDPFFIHSWHAGIHPGCKYSQRPSESFERWSGGAFGNPRLLHFHTCGDYPPGEISLNILDATVYIDDVAVWQHGTLIPDRLIGGHEILESYPVMRTLFESPCLSVGQNSDNKLSYD
ncbi:MAG: hypothetical protein OXC68_03820 [Aestuariivita sp.]|nr:hypothetical protein [Aestuariivita sp.]